MTKSFNWVVVTVSASQHLTREVGLRGGFTVPFYGLFAVVLVVLGAGLLLAHAAAVTVLVGVVLVAAGIVLAVSVTRRDRTPVT